MATKASNENERNWTAGVHPTGWRHSRVISNVPTCVSRVRCSQGGGTCVSGG